MPRPKKETEAGKLATQKWRETMTRKYGSPSQKMAEVGRIGGTNGRGPNYKGGFAADRDKARIAGAKGGSISRRTSKYEKEMNARLPEIKAELAKPYYEINIKALSRRLEIPYSSLAYYIKKRKREQVQYSIVEQKFDVMMGLIKDLPRADYNRLKDAMDLGWSAYQKIRNVKTLEEKELEDIVDSEAVLSKLNNEEK